MSLTERKAHEFAIITSAADDAVSMKIHKSSGMYSAHYLTSVIIANVIDRDLEAGIITRELYDATRKSASLVVNRWLTCKSTIEMFERLKSQLAEDEPLVIKLEQSEYGGHRGYYFHKLVIQSFVRRFYPPYTERVDQFVLEMSKETDCPSDSIGIAIVGSSACVTNEKQLLIMIRSDDESMMVAFSVATPSVIELLATRWKLRCERLGKRSTTIVRGLIDNDDPLERFRKGVREFATDTTARLGLGFVELGMSIQRFQVEFKCGNPNLYDFKHLQFMIKRDILAITKSIDA